MSVEIKIRKGETVDKALRRLKKKIDREGIIKDARAKRGFEKPAERRRRKKKVKNFGAYLRKKWDNAFSTIERERRSCISSKGRRRRMWYSCTRGFNR